MIPDTPETPMPGWIDEIARQFPVVLLMALFLVMFLRYAAVQHARELAGKSAEIDRLVEELKLMRADKNREIERLLRERKPFTDFVLKSANSSRTIQPGSSDRD